MDASTIFQRTDSGRDTIRTKTHKLTQSERLLLIIIDGVRPLDVLRKEVWSLSQDRFERALRTLLKKELISEVLLPIQGQEAEELDTAEVDRFLQQDPLDPVTIISFDPEDEFGVDFNPFAPAPPQAPAPPAVPVAAPEPVVPEEPAEVAAPVEQTRQEPATPEIAPDDLALKSLSIKLAHDKEQEEEPFSIPPPELTAQPVPADPIASLGDDWPENMEQGSPEASAGQWIYWAALISGIGIIVGSLLFRVFA